MKGNNFATRFYNSDAHLGVHDHQPCTPWRIFAATDRIIKRCVHTPQTPTILQGAPTANADERVSILSEQNDLLQQRMNAVKKEVAGSYEQSVLAKKQAEMFMLERDAMVSKMKTTLTEIDALRASWMSCVEETREVRSQNEALYAHNNRLEIEYTNISVQLEEAMQEAAKSQMKMMEILRDTTGLRNARDKAYSDLETSSMEKLALKTDSSRT